MATITPDEGGGISPRAIDLSIKIHAQLPDVGLNLGEVTDALLLTLVVTLATNARKHGINLATIERETIGRLRWLMIVSESEEASNGHART